VEAFDRRPGELGGEEKNTLQESGIEFWLFKVSLLTAVSAHLFDVVNTRGNGDVLFHILRVETRGVTSQKNYRSSM
jgi:hypothetical protein